MTTELSLFWFRRDLRLDDNAGLYYALKNEQKVQCIFIFDTSILDKLEDKRDARVHFIYLQIEKLKTALNKLGSDLWVFYGEPKEIYTTLFKQYTIKSVYCNHDYEMYAQERDTEINALCKLHNSNFFTFKDQVIFEKDEVLKDDGKPYTVFTPYSRKWKAKLNDFYVKSYPTENYFEHLHKGKSSAIISLKDIGFDYSDIQFPEDNIDINIIKTYNKTRDIPSIQGTTQLSVHLRFGTISIRKLAQIALKHNETYLNELIWREFYMMILWHFPHVVDKAFKPAYDHIKWKNNETHFDLWCQGKTGFPIVDAGMRQLNETGYMHNRVRMIVASFLVKDLLIDWRWGEAYFANKLLDFDLSANNGGWQWAAGSGCDAAPYFRIFNPESQQKKFDPDLKYVKQWVPEFDDPFKYSAPIIDRKLTRNETLEAYKEALQ